MKIAKILALALVCVLTATMFMACSTYSSTTTTDADGTTTTRKTENGVTTETVEKADDEDADADVAEPAEGGATIDDMKAKFTELADLYDGGMEAVAATENADLIETYKQMGEQLRELKDVIATKGDSATEDEITEGITMIDALIEQVSATLEQVG